MSNAPATPATTETRVRIGRNGAKVHRGNADGNTYCGAQRRVGTRQGVTFLAADTAVTCVKCNPAAAAAAPAPAAAPERVRCTNVVYGEVCGNLYRPALGCGLCA